MMNPPFLTTLPPLPPPLVRRIFEMPAYAFRTRDVSSMSLSIRSQKEWSGSVSGSGTWRNSRRSRSRRQRRRRDALDWS